jgi:hypothetical protein
VRSAPDCLRPPSTNPGHYCAPVLRTHRGSGRLDWPNPFVIAAATMMSVRSAKRAMSCIRHTVADSREHWGLAKHKTENQGALSCGWVAGGALILVRPSCVTRSGRIHNVPQAISCRAPVHGRVNPRPGRGFPAGHALREGCSCRLPQMSSHSLGFFALQLRQALAIGATATDGPVVAAAGEVPK